MRQWCEIAARSYAALRRHHWRHSAIEHLADGVDREGAHARVAFRQRVGAEEHHGPCVRNRQWLADSDGVRSHEIDLQFANLVANDVHVAKLSYACCDGIRNLVAGDEFVDNRAGTIDGFARVGSEKHGLADIAARHFAHSFQRQVVSVDVLSVQDGPQFPVLNSQFCFSRKTTLKGYNVAVIKPFVTAGSSFIIWRAASSDSARKTASPIVVSSVVRVRPTRMITP